MAKEKQVQVFSNALQSETEEQIEAEIHDGAYKSKQASLFEQQLDLAVELRTERGHSSARRLGGHARDSAPITDGKVRGVFHCFGGTLEQANEVLGMGHLVSFTGIVTFKNGTNVREVAAQNSAR